MAHGSLARGRKVRIDGGHENFHGPGNVFPDESVLSAYGFTFVVARESQDAGHFHLIRMKRENDTWGNWDFINESQGVVYQPLHPTVTAEDVEGATYAWDDGTHWHFAHCSPDEQIDLAAEVRTFTEQQFFTAIAAASSAGLRASITGDARTTQGRKAGALTLFATQAGDKAHDAVLAESLGHFHRNPHSDHKREVARAAITAVIGEWKKAAEAEGASDEVKARHTLVESLVTAIVTKLSSAHTLTTYHESRLAAPKFAAPKTGPQQSWTVGTAITPVQAPTPAGYPAVTYSSPHLPTGLALDGTTGEITGAPVTSGQGMITVVATNSEGTDSWTFNYTIARAGD